MTALQPSQQVDLFGGFAPPIVRRSLPVKPVITQQPNKIRYEGMRVFIKPTRIFAMPSFAGGIFIRSIAQRAAEANLSNNKRAGDLSRKAQDKIRDAVNWLCLAAKKKRIYHKPSNKVYQFKVNFITLTLPDTSQEITPEIFKTKLLQPWLSYARQYMNLNNYVWKLERQKNGKLHVHITTDTFIFYKDLRRSWNYQLDRNGFLDDFAAKFGHKDAPSEQVKAVKSIRNMAAYCAKYVAKTSGELKIFEGRIWGCNYEISASNRIEVFAAATEEALTLGCLQLDTITEIPMLGKIKANGFPQFLGVSFYVTADHWLRNISGAIKQKFDDYIHYIRTGVPFDVPITIPIQYQ